MIPIHYIMLDKLDYSLVPYDFAFCFDGKCRRASTCLRYQASRYIPKESWAVRVVNPQRVVPDGDCCGFMDDSPLRNAYGMDHLLDNIPYREAKEIRREMREYFGTTHFYRLKRKERCFTPEGQQYVHDLLRRYGVEGEPVFDRYEENFGWECNPDTTA